MQRKTRISGSSGECYSILSPSGFRMFGFAAVRLSYWGSRSFLWSSGWLASVRNRVSSTRHCSRRMQRGCPAHTGPALFDQRSQ
jgi:hypothetical protein